MARNYRNLLPSGDSRNEQPEQERTIFYDPEEYQRRVEAVTEGRLLEDVVEKTIDLLENQLQQLRSVPMDTLRNNRNKVLSQNINIVPVVEQNAQAAHVLNNVAQTLYNSDLMNRYIDELTRDEREQWQLSEVDKAKIAGGKETVEHIKKKGDEMIARLEQRAVYNSLWKRAVDAATMLSMFCLLLWFGKTAEQVMSGSVIIIAALIIAFPYIVRVAEKFFFNPNRSLGPISSCDVKVFSCSPESKECLPLIHGPHKT
ncbi:MAG: hypothetical protein J6Q22_21050 [Prevotella sp.]|nr:hypothetical protein [Prevotella sp.]